VFSFSFFFNLPTDSKKLLTLAGPLDVDFALYNPPSFKFDLGVLKPLLKIPLLLLREVFPF